MSDDDREFTFTDVTTGELELVGQGIDATGVARPGDILVLSYSRSQMTLTVEDAARMRDELMARLPGIADVVLTPFRLELIYRQDEPS